MIHPAPVFVADHVVLDFLNTRLRVDGADVDAFWNDEDVVRWLEAANLLPPETSLRRAAKLRLEHTAKMLRLDLRELLEDKQRGAPLQLDLLNRYLHGARKQFLLVRDDEGKLRIDTSFGHANPLDLLMPIVVAAAELFVHGDFDLVRRCESEDCRLLFYDRTKSHRRRWCSAATCGNRDKVTRFRARQAKT